MVLKKNRYALKIILVLETKRFQSKSPVEFTLYGLTFLERKVLLLKDEKNLILVFLLFYCDWFVDLMFLDE